MKQSIKAYQDIREWIRYSRVDKHTYKNCYRYIIIKNLTNRTHPRSTELYVLRKYQSDISVSAWNQLPKRLQKLFCDFDSAMTNEALKR